MVINIKGKSEALQDLEKAKKLIDEAGKILYRVPTKIEFEVSGTEKESDAIQALIFRWNGRIIGQFLKLCGIMVKMFTKIIDCDFFHGNFSFLSYSALAGACE